MSKGKLSSEEVRLQLAENIPGSIEIFANAIGMSEAEMFKQMETGKLLAEDVLPKVAKEYSRVARENGALGKAQEKVNSQYQRFLNALTDIKIAMFEGGMGKGLADSFKLMAEFLQDNKSGFAALGQTIGTTIKTVASALTIALQPIMLLVKAFNNLFGDAGAKVLGTVIAITGLSRAVSLLSMAFAAANVGFMALIRNVAKYGIITTAALGFEDLYVGARGGGAVSRDMGLMDWMQKSSMGKAFAAQSPLMWATGNAQKALNINLSVNDGEFAKAIDVRVDQKTDNAKANTLASLGG